MGMIARPFEVVYGMNIDQMGSMKDVRVRGYEGVRSERLSPQNPS